MEMKRATAYVLSIVCMTSLENNMRIIWVGAAAVCIAKATLSMIRSGFCQRNR